MSQRCNLSLRVKSHRKGSFADIGRGAFFVPQPRLSRGKAFAGRQCGVCLPGLHLGVLSFLTETRH